MKTKQEKDNSVKNQNQYNLIKGEFSVEDAEGIINHLISQKINYHEMRSFGSQVRFGVIDEFSKERVKELKKNKQKINALIKQAQVEGKKLRLISNISIELI